MRTPIVEALIRLRSAKAALKNLPVERTLSIALTQLETAELWLLRLDAEVRANTKPGEPDIVIPEPCSQLPPDMPCWQRLLLGCGC